MLERDTIKFFTLNEKTVTFIMFIVASAVTIASQSIITTGLKYLMIDFSITQTTAQLTYSLFLLVLGVMIPPSAYIIHRFKIKHILLTVLIVFTIGSFVSYISNNIWILIIGRILQAAGTGILMPLTQILLFKLIPEEKWSLMMGILGFIIGIVPALGPTIGGIIIDLSSWRNIFLMFTLLGIILIFLTLIFGKYELETTDYPLDWSSLILSVIICLGIMVGVSNISDYGPDIIYVVLPIVLGLISLTLFAYRQNKIQNPLINLKVLDNKYFIFGTVFISLLYFTMSSINVLMPLYVQNIANYSATTSGIVLLPGTLLLIFFNFIGSLLADKFGIRKVLLVSCLLSIIGFLLMMTYDINTSQEYLIITQIIRCVGAGLGFTPATTWTMSVVSSLVEDATAINNTLRQIFGAIGTSISVVILTLFAGGSVGHNSISVRSFSATSLIMALIIFVTLIIVILFVRDIKEIKE